MNSNNVESLIVSLETIKEKWGNLPVNVLFYAEDGDGEEAAVLDIDGINVSSVEIGNITTSDKEIMDMVLLIVDVRDTDGK